MGSGFTLSRTTSTGQNTGGAIPNISIDPTNTTPIYLGDPVVVTGGFIEQGSSTGPYHGVFTGCIYHTADGDVKHSKFWNGSGGNTDVRANLSGAENQTYIIEADASLGAVAATVVGARHNVIIGTGNPSTGFSDATLGAASATGPCYVIGKLDTPGNNWGEAQIKLEVSISTPQRTA